MGKNPPANGGTVGDVGSIPGLGRPPRAGNGNPLQYSCRENSMVRGAWRAMVQEVARSQTQLSVQKRGAENSNWKDRREGWKVEVWRHREGIQVASGWRKDRFKPTGRESREAKEKGRRSPWRGSLCGERLPRSRKRVCSKWDRGAPGLLFFIPRLREVESFKVPWK